MRQGRIICTIRAASQATPHPGHQTATAYDSDIFPAYPGYTFTFTETLKKYLRVNAGMARKVKLTNTALLGVNWYGAQLVWFGLKVKNNGPWDFKRSARH